MNPFKRIAWCLWIVFLLDGMCGATGFQPAFQARSREEIRDIISWSKQVTDSEMPARILYRNVSWVVTSETSIEQQEEVLLEIIGDKAKHEYGDLRISFDSRFTTVNVELAETWLPDGTVLPIMEGADNELVPPELMEAAVYGDLKTRVISFSSAEAGSILHWHTIITTDYPTGSRFIWDSLQLQTDIPIMNLLFSLSYPDILPVKIRLRNCAEQPMVEQRDGWVYQSWQRTDVKPVIEEWSMPHMNDIVPLVMVTCCKDMNHLGQWFHKVFYTETCGDPSVAESEWGKTLAELGQNPPDIMLERCFRLVLDHIKTIDLPAGVRGYQPSSPASVLSRGYGDALDKARLLNALLSASGIESDIVFLPESRDRRPGNFSSLDGLDSIAVIASLSDASEKWLNPVDRNARVGWVYRGEGIQGIRFHGGTAESIDIPVPSAYESVSRRRICLRVHRDGTADGDMIWQGSGWFEHRLRRSFRDVSPGLQHIRIERDFGDSVIPLLLNKLDMPDWSMFGGIPEMRLEFSSPYAGLKTGEMMVIPMPDLPLQLIRQQFPLSEPGRQQKVELGAPGVETVRIEVFLPNGYKLVYHPESGFVENDRLKITQSVDVHESKVVLIRCYRWKGSLLQPSQFEAVTADYNSYSQPSQNMLIVKKILND
ncbi:DUF3857 domain-containing protein [bacterium]|nr:DUF3857 domain-containing protein [candidate division CSSED10-310 bacterium]